MNGEIVSLFSGIGGLELGLERAGLGKTTHQVETDGPALQVLAGRFPHVERRHDIREFVATDIDADIIAGGFPCQDASIASGPQRLGMEGTRTGLWSEMRRIISQTRPRWVVAENVSGLLNKGFGAVLRDLANIGYDAEWHCIPAGFVGAPHPRWRLFVVAYPAGEHGPAWGSLVPSARCWREPVQSGGLPGVLAPSPWGKGAPWDGSPPAACGMDDGISKRVDRLRLLGNAVVPQVAELVGRSLR